MGIWDEYPIDYRKQEVEYILKSVLAGDCVSVLGLSGSGKSNLMGYLANRGYEINPDAHFVYVDCNRLTDITPGTFYRMIHNTVRGGNIPTGEVISNINEFQALEGTISTQLREGNRLCILLDRFEIISESKHSQNISSNLRALRDAWKYWLTYVISSRRQLKDNTELAELVQGRIIWLGPLTYKDAVWSAKRDLKRYKLDKQTWDEKNLEKLYELSWGYASILRACCEAYASGETLSIEAMQKNPGVTRRCEEFWLDRPTNEMLELSRIKGHPLLNEKPSQLSEEFLEIDYSILTAKEKLLLDYLLAHEGQVCEKDNLIRAVWPEDVIYEKGIRDDSLAQLIRRLRKKIEPRPNSPRIIRTIPGRGYLLQSSNQC